jgi:hypothetical protein
LAGLSGACNTPPPSSQTSTEIVVGEAMLESYDAAWTFVVSDPINTSTLLPTPPATFDPAAAAMQVAAGTAANFSPPSCVSATAAGDVATFVFSNCQQGPLSLRTINGTVTATYSNTANGPQVQIASMNLFIAGSPVNLNATGTITQTANLRTVTLTSHTTSGSMDPNSRIVTETISWVKGTPCLTVSGTGTQVSAGTTTEITISSTQQCSAQCPKAGTVTATGGNTTSTLTFNGTSSTDVLENNGTSVGVTLPCP